MEVYHPIYSGEGIRDGRKDWIYKDAHSYSTDVFSSSCLLNLKLLHYLLGSVRNLPPRTRATWALLLTYSLFT